MNEELIFFIKENINWDIDSISYTERVGGLSSTNYKVKYDNNYYFIRICTHTYLHTDRVNELQVLNIASNNNLTLKPYYYSVETGNMIVPWISGHMPTEAEFSSKTFIENLSNKLKKLHSLNCKKIFDPFNHIRLRIHKCNQYNIPLPHYIDVLLEKLDNLESTLTIQPTLGLCHNDLNASNMLLSNDDLYFVDYEYSCMGDIFLDLATVSWLLDEPSRKELLIQYFGYYKNQDYKKLLDYLYVVKLYNATWSLLKTKDSNNDYDYLNGASITFEELKQELITIKY